MPQLTKMTVLPLGNRLADRQHWPGSCRLLAVLGRPEPALRRDRHRWRTAAAAATSVRLVALAWSCCSAASAGARQAESIAIAPAAVSTTACAGAPGCVLRVHRSSMGWWRARLSLWLSSHIIIMNNLWSRIFGIISVTRPKPGCIKRSQATRCRRIRGCRRAAAPPAGRPRDPAVDSRALAAARDVLAERGYAGSHLRRGRPPRRSGQVVAVPALAEQSRPGRGCSRRWHRRPERHRHRDAAW